MKGLSPQLTLKEGEAAEEGQPSPTKNRGLGRGEAAVPAMLPGPHRHAPAQRGLCQTHLLQHTPRRLILLRQRQTEGDAQTPGEADRVGKTAVTRKSQTGEAQTRGRGREANVSPRLDQRALQGVPTSLPGPAPEPANGGRWGPG